MAGEGGGDREQPDGANPRSHFTIRPGGYILARADRGYHGGGAQGAQSVRNDALMLFLLDTGVRTSGLCEIWMENTDPVICWVTVCEKGQESYVVFQRAY